MQESGKKQIEVRYITSLKEDAHVLQSQSKFRILFLKDQTHNC